VSLRLRDHDRFALAILVAIVATRVIGSLTLPIYDDAFITFRYAVNLAEGRGFVYQPNEWVLGTTAPLFGLIGAAMHALGLSLPVAVPLLNLGCELAVAALTISVVAKEHGRLAAVLFGAAFALSPMLVRISVGGMEANLFLLATLLSLHLYARGWSRYAVAIAAASYFLRPEGVLTVGLLCIMTVGSGRWRQALALSVIALAIVAPGLLAMHHYYGSIVPHSVIAKAGAPRAALVQVVRSLVLPNAVSAALLLLGIPGVSRLARSTGLLRSMLFWVLAYLAAYCLARPQIWSWYSEPVQYVLCVLAGIGASRVLVRWRAWAEARSELVASAAAAGAVAMWLAVYVMQGRSGVTRNVYRAMNEFFRQYPTGEAVIFAEDIGAVGYYSHGRVYDAAGLVTPDALRYTSVPARIDAVRPRYLLVNATRAEITMLRDGGFLHDYTAVRRFSPSGESTVVQDPQQYSAEWVQSYVWYARSGDADRVATRGLMRREP